MTDEDRANLGHDVSANGDRPPGDVETDPADDPDDTPESRDAALKGEGA